MRRVLFAVTILALAACGTARLTVRGEVLAEVSPRLFGSFLERYVGKEPGPELARTPGTRRLRPAIMAAIRAQAVPLLRFPGGTTVDYLDWRELISKVTGRDAPRPPSTLWGGTLGNEFGLDEFLDLCGEIRCEPLLVTAFLPAVTGDEAVAAVAERAAAMVAYCNGRVGAPLPGDLERWPELRRVNGREEPWGVRLWQIGNETWARVEGAAGRTLAGEDGYPEPLATRYREALVAVAQAMRAVDPGIVLITDGPRSPRDEVLLATAAHPAVKTTIDLLSNHAYAPGPAARGWEAPPGFGDADHWATWTAMPGLFDELGFNRARSEQYALFAGLGYPTAATEWNWNGWGCQQLEPAPGFDVRQAAGIGAAGFLHGLLREAGKVELANQSLFLGCRWEGISAIHYDPADSRPPHLTPTGLATALVRRHHGKHLLVTEARGFDTYEQPLAPGWARPAARVAWLDALATADEDEIFIHVINRSFEEDRALVIELPMHRPTSDLARRITWQASRQNPAPPITDLDAAFTETPVRFRPGEPVVFPARSLSVLRIPVEAR